MFSTTSSPRSSDSESLFSQPSVFKTFHTSWIENDRQTEEHFKEITGHVCCRFLALEENDFSSKISPPLLDQPTLLKFHSSSKQLLLEFSTPLPSPASPAQHRSNFLKTMICKHRAVEQNRSDPTRLGELDLKLYWIGVLLDVWSGSESETSLQLQRKAGLSTSLLPFCSLAFDSILRNWCTWFHHLKRWECHRR